MRRILLLIPGLLAGLPLHAQGTALMGNAENSARISPPVTPARGAFQSLLSTLFADASQDDKKVTLNTGFRLGGAAATFTASTALNEDGPTEVANIGGLAAGTTLALGWTPRLWTVNQIDDQDRIDWCNAHEAVKSSVDCNHPNTYGSFGPTKGEPWSDEISASYPSNTYLLLQVTGELGHSSLEYLDVTSYEQKKEDAYSGSIGAQLGYVGRGFVVAGGARFEGKWDEEDKAEICVPTGIAGAVQCRNAALGRATYERDLVTNAQFRRYLGPHLAFQYQVDYRPERGGWAMELPIYFAPNGDGALIGGVKPAYDFHEEDFSISVFVGSAFKLF